MGRMGIGLKAPGRARALTRSGSDAAANSRFSVLTLIFSPSLMKVGTRISRPVSRRASLVTLPAAVSPRTEGSV